MTHHDVFLYPGVARLATVELVISGSSPSSASGPKFRHQVSLPRPLAKYLLRPGARLPEAEKSD